jgi:uncharacterized protein YraI
MLTGQLYVRTGPSRSNPSVGVLPAGEQVVILGRQGEWLHIQWPARGAPQLDGWIWGGLVSE